MKNGYRTLIYKIIFVAVVMIVAIFSAVYTSILPVEQKAIASMIGFDTTENGINLTAHILTPVTEAKTQFAQSVVEADGDNVFDALNKFSIKLGKKVELEFCGMLVFGAGALQEGVLDECKALFSSGVVSAGVLLVGSDTMTANEFLTLANDFGEESSKGVSSFLTFFEKTLDMPIITLSDFLRSNLGESNASIVPCVDIKKIGGSESASGSSGEKNSGADGGSSGSSQDSSPKAEIDNTDKTVILKNGKSVGIISGGAKDGLMILDNHIHLGKYLLKSFEYNGNTFSNLSLDINSKNVKTRSYYDGSTPNIDYNIKLKLTTISKYKFLPLLVGGFDIAEFYDALGKAVENGIKQAVVDCTQKARELNADFLGVYYRFCRLNSNSVKKYNSTLDNFLDSAKFNVSVSASVI